MGGDRITRRAVIAGGTALSVGILAGCGGVAGRAEEGTPTPVALSGGKQDDQGGMIIGEHFGPNGQVFYADHTPRGHDGPAWFHTLVHGLFPYHFARTRRGWEAAAVYVTDYSTVEYDVVTRTDRTYLSSHTAPETLGDARVMKYVIESAVRGGMGKALIPFGEDGDAAEFVDEYGGETIRFADIDRQLLSDYRQS